MSRFDGDENRLCLLRRTPSRSRRSSGVARSYHVFLPLGEEDGGWRGRRRGPRVSVVGGTSAVDAPPSGERACRHDSHDGVCVDLVGGHPHILALENGHVGQRVTDRQRQPQLVRAGAD
eukprot:7376991-Prymnesium_polylepis.5